MVSKRIRDDIARHFSPYGYRIQLFGYITPHKGTGEFTLNCYAARWSRRWGFQVVEVNRSWSNRPYYYTKNIWKGFWGSTRVVFDEARERPGQEVSWYKDKWGKPLRWDKDDSWFISYVSYMNLDALQDTKYKYCAYKDYFGPLSLMKYIRLYQKHKEIEFLVKSGLNQFIKESFLDKMARRKELRDFFRSQVKTMLAARKRYTPNDIIRARANGWSLEKANEINTANRICRHAPKGVDKVRLYHYLCDNNIDLYDYYHYVKAVADARMDILGYGVTFPRDFHDAVKKVHKKIARVKAREERAREKSLIEAAARIDKLLTKMKNKLAWKYGNLSVIIPTTRKEFENEGRAMHNCIGGYFDSCADGNTICFFIRKSGKRLADVECGNDGRLRQCRLKMNRAPDDETRIFATVMAKKIAAVMKKKNAA